MAAETSPFRVGGWIRSVKAMAVDCSHSRIGGSRVLVGVKAMAAEGSCSRVGSLRVSVGVKVMAAEGSHSRVFPIGLHFFSFDKVFITISLLSLLKSEISFKVLLVLFLSK